MEPAAGGQAGGPAAQQQQAQEEEPRLKYQALGGDVPRILRGGGAARRLAVSDKLLALGTVAGSVHLLDYAGNEVGGRCSSNPSLGFCSSDGRLCAGTEGGGGLSLFLGSVPLPTGGYHLLGYAGN